MCRTGAVGAMLAPEGRETGCRESTESSVDTGSGTKGGVSLAFKDTPFSRPISSAFQARHGRPDAWPAASMSQHLGLGSWRGTATDLLWSHEVENYAPACQSLPAAGCRQRRREDLAAAVETMMLIAEGHMLPVEKVFF